jgi:hypothetical protein
MENVEKVVKHHKPRKSEVCGVKLAFEEMFKKSVV